MEVLGISDAEFYTVSFFGQGGVATQQSKLIVLNHYSEEYVGKSELISNEYDKVELLLNDSHHETGLLPKSLS